MVKARSRIFGSIATTPRRAEKDPCKDDHMNHKTGAMYQIPYSFVSIVSKIIPTGNIDHKTFQGSLFQGRDGTPQRRPLEPTLDTDRYQVDIWSLGP